MIRVIPNIITLMNLACGCIAIVLVFDGALITASWLIIAAAILDFFDGTVARLLNARSEMGKQLDSLADIVSFGVAPSCIIYTLMVTALGLQADHYIQFAAIPAFFIAVFSALRLARFNIDSTQTHSFRGLPTPVNGLFICALPFILIQAQTKGGIHLLFGSWLDNYFVLLGLTITMCFLMVSNLPLIGFKTQLFIWRKSKFKYLFVVAAVVLILLLGTTAAPFVLGSYIVISLIDHYTAKHSDVEPA